LAANTIHALSSRSKGPFVWVNCASIPEALIDAELFGYEGGAFTGAQSRGKVGKFELANGGTLFLDEIGDMPFHLQGSLLRAVQNQEIVRIGGTSPIVTDVRIICATNRPIKALVRSGAFRPDLYYRLSAMTIHVPALRERDDIKPFIEQLLKRIALRENRPLKQLQQSVLSRFLKYSWPGNIRELENALLQFLISGEIALDEDAYGEAGTETHAERGASMTLQEHLEHQRKVQIRRVLSAVNNDKDKAARVLGISRATLYRELQAMH
jgi:transcriptional regulator with PAS, ATPase and Fis domain